jgi:hypothetical protein
MEKKSWKRWKNLAWPPKGEQPRLLQDEHAQSRPLDVTALPRLGGRRARFSVCQWRPRRLPPAARRDRGVTSTLSAARHCQHVPNTSPVLAGGRPAPWPECAPPVVVGDSCKMSERSAARSTRPPPSPRASGWEPAPGGPSVRRHRRDRSETSTRSAVTATRPPSPVSAGEGLVPDGPSACRQLHGTIALRRAVRASITATA